MGMDFIKLNKDPINVEYTLDPNRPLEPTFRWEGKRYYLSEFLSVHNNPWIGTTSYPKYINGVEIGNHHNPVMIEIVSNYSVNIYEQKGES